MVLEKKVLWVIKCCNFGTNMTLFSCKTKVIFAFATVEVAISSPVIIGW